MELARSQAELEKSQSQFMNDTNITLNRQSAQIKNIEVKLGQMATRMNERQQGSLPSTLEVNPRKEGKEHCKAISLRSGRALEASKEVEKPLNDTKEAQPSILPPSVGKDEKEQVVVTPPQEETPKISYPQRLDKSKLDCQFTKFLEVFKKPHINIPFADALEQILSYVKFMKDILAKKRKFKEY